MATKQGELCMAPQVVEGPRTVNELPAGKNAVFNLIAGANISLSVEDIVQLPVKKLEYEITEKIEDLGLQIKEQRQQLVETRKILLKELRRQVTALQHPAIATGEAFYKARGLAFNCDRMLSKVSHKDHGTNVDDDEFENLKDSEVGEYSGDETRFYVVLRLYSSKRKITNYGGSSLQYEDSIDVHAELAAELVQPQLASVKQAAATLQKLIDSQSAWRIKLSGLSRAAAEARSGLVEATLNQSEEGQALLQALNQTYETQAQRMKLPGAVCEPQKLCHQPAEETKPVATKKRAKAKR